MEEHAKAQGEEHDEFMGVDSKSNAIDSLETAASFLDRSDDFKWKWVAISIHHAFYSFCIVAFERGNPAWVLSAGKDKDDRGNFWKRGGEPKYFKSKRAPIDEGYAYRIVWEETDEKPPAPKKEKPYPDLFRRKLIDFRTALARIQDDRWMGRNVHSKPIILEDEECKSIVWLANEVRNNLVHFVPKHWGISINGIKGGSLTAIKVIEFLVFESNTIYFLADEDLTRVRAAVSKLRAGLAD